MLKDIKRLMLLTVVLVCATGAGVEASDKFAVNTSADLYSRYVWRGMDFGNAPSLQPALSFSYIGIELGVWGAYTLSNQATEFDELDFWLGYSYGFENESSIGVVLTDYYFPNGGIKFFNFNNYDAVDANGDPDPGAHILELGLSYTGPRSFPMTFSGYVSVYNDAGNNAYFQVDYPFAAGETDLTVFCGAALGHEDNPSIYKTDEFAVINVGVSAERRIKITESYGLPLSLAFILNPNEEISYLVAGVKF